MLKDKLHFQIMRCFQNLNNDMIKQTSNIDLSPGWPKVLEYLYERDGVLAKEICDNCYFDKSTVSSILNAMEKEKLITRQKLSTDKRCSAIYLTDYGREKAEQLLPIAKSIDDFALSGVTEEEKEQVFEALQKIIDNYKRRNNE